MEIDRGCEAGGPAAGDMAVTLGLPGDGPTTPSPGLLPGPGRAP